MIVALNMAFLFVACDGDNEVTFDDEVIGSEVMLSAVFEDADDLAGISMAAADGSTGGRNSANDDDRLSCATVIHNPETKTITIDWGDGCEDPRGNIRAGKIIINYTGRRFIPGSVITITFENYSINGIQIEGTRSIENISENLDVPPKFQITLRGGKITWPDGSFATREVNRTRTWVRASNPLNDEFHVDGIASGVNRRGIEYSVTITETLVWIRRCRIEGSIIPVSGVKEVIRNGELVVIDFGEGECDNIVTASKDGHKKQIDILSVSF